MSRLVLTVLDCVSASSTITVRVYKLCVGVFCITQYPGTFDFWRNWKTVKKERETGPSAGGWKMMMTCF